MVSLSKLLSKSIPVSYLSGNIFDSTMEAIDIKFFIDYLLDSGIHGFAEGHERDNKYQPIKENKFAYYMRTIFLTNKGYKYAKLLKEFQKLG